VTAGVVFNPASNELLWARRGDGAWCGTERLRVSACAAMKDAFMLHSDLHLLREAGYWDRFLKMLDASGRTRGFGDYYGYGLVAAGKAEIYLETDLKPWDAAPVKILVEEAGGRLTDFAGAPTIYSGSVLATNGHLHDLALRALAG
jgi:histidinol-phosphatase